MVDKINKLLSGIWATIISGFFLIASLILILCKINFIFDPAWITIIISGLPLLYLAVRRIFIESGMKKISSALLISIAMVASIVIGELFAAGEVAFIMALGAILEDYTVERAKKGIKSLMKLAPEQGRKIIKIEGKIVEEMISVDAIQLNDRLRVLPGEKIPVDGKIILGNTSIDQAIITGESLPADKTVNDEVYCGTINQFGSIEILATKIGEDSTLKKLIKMVQDAENNKAPMQRIVDKWASWLVPVALLIAIITYFVFQDLTRAVTILVVFCPCSLALATPTSIMAAIGQATKYGVLIKSGEALEKMGKVNCIAFDKTGTLTYGKLKVSDVKSFDKTITEEELLKLVASIESYSEHPIGKAITEYVKELKIELIEIIDFEMIPGNGVKAKLNDEIVYCGNSRFLSNNQIILSDKENNEIDSLKNEAKAIIIVAKANAVLGSIALSDTLKDNAKSMIDELKLLNNKVVLLTGDNLLTANYFASQLGILK